MATQTGNSERPDCHGAPMLWHLDRRKPGRGYWTCRVERQEYKRQRYDALTGTEYNRLLLRMRRNKALERRRNREAA